MRLHTMELCGIGPFRHPQSIDFDTLTASGLFLIEGPTGSGKTTIIDAIVFALYGSLSGAESDTGRLRSHLCGPDEPTEITLTFSIDGVRHTITRNPAYERLKARGAGTTPERARQTLVVHDDTTPPMREAREIGIYLQQRLGLTVEQFRRLVVLPQGEFDSLLRAKPADRYRTLSSLIDDRLLERVQDDLKRAADDAARARDDASARVEQLLTMGRQRAAEVLDAEAIVDADPDALVGALQEAAAQASAHLTALATVLDAARQAEATARQSLAAAEAADGARQAIALASAGLDPHDAALDDSGLRARASELVARRTRLEPLAAWESLATDREREGELVRATAAELHSALDQARAEVEQLPEQRRALAAKLADARAAAAALSALDADVTHWERIADLLGQRDRLTTSLAAARSAETTAAEARQRSRDHAHAARMTAADVLRRQLDQRAAHLATLLVDGEACPVCGSAEHPHPATADTEPLVSDEDVSIADAAVRAADAAEAAADTSYRDAQRTTADIDKELAAVAAQVGDTTADAVAASLDRARIAARQAREAAEEIDALAEQDAALASTQGALTASIESLVDQAATARTAVEAFDERVRTETARYRAELGEADTARAAIEHIDGQRSAIEGLLQARSHAGDASDELDPATAARLAAEAKTALDAAERDHLAAQQRAIRVDEALAAVSTLRETWQEAVHLATTTASTTAAAIQLGALVTARSNANIRKLTLQAYAVQRRFRAVLEAASVHLERMSSGKYSFALDETASGNAQSGLGIDIADAWSGQTRDPATLSGGETFYASLALALGLADVVREESGGVTLETLFVDEGFGSLDADTLSVVLDQLDALRARGRAVGVISHVAEMKEWVHDRIEVVPGSTPAAGSSLRQSGA